jgi:hypothetical protein
VFNIGEDGNLGGRCGYVLKLQARILYLMYACEGNNSLDLECSFSRLDHTPPAAQGYRAQIPQATCIPVAITLYVRGARALWTINKLIINDPSQRNWERTTPLLLNVSGKPCSANCAQQS